MTTIALEIVWSSLVPGAALVLLTLATQRILTAPRAMADSVALAVCFAAGQTRILGDMPWPPTETAHALVPLAFVAVVPRPRPAATWMVAYAILNIGVYFALYPLFTTALTTVMLQAIVAQLALALALWSSARLPSLVVTIATVIGLMSLGMVLIRSGSTSLAMTAWLLAALTAGEAVVCHVRRRSPDHRILQPAFAILLTMELINYVL